MRPRGKKRLLAPLVIATGLALSSCGSAAPKPSVSGVSTLTRSSPALHTIPSSRPARPAGIPVGSPQRVAAAGTTLVVTVSRVINPLRGSAARVPAGMELVGVLITARNAGPGGYDSSYTSDFALLFPGGRAMPVFARAGVCMTHVQDFMNQLGAAQTRSGCIAYLVPRGKAPTAVRLEPDGGTAHHSVTWTVP